MTHVKTISKKPACAADIPVSDKITFIVALLEAFSPILEAKNTAE